MESIAVFQQFNAIETNSIDTRNLIISHRECEKLNEEFIAFFFFRHYSVKVFHRIASHTPKCERLPYLSFPKETPISIATIKYFVENIKKRKRLKLMAQHNLVVAVFPFFSSFFESHFNLIVRCIFSDFLCDLNPWQLWIRNNHF